MANENYKIVKERLEGDSVKSMIQSSLPSSMDVAAWTNGALAHIGSDKDILEATPKSTIAAVLEASTLGVRFEGPLGEAYLETRFVKTKEKDAQGNFIKEKVTQLQIQYRGLMKLARRDPSVRKIEAIIVHEADIFKHQLGTNLFLDHTWDVKKPRGKAVAVYAAIRYHDGFYDFGQPYPIEHIYDHRKNVLDDKKLFIGIGKDKKEHLFRYWFKNGNRNERQLDPYEERRVAWFTYFPAMAQKTAVRWSAKFWELSPDFDRAAGLISLVESGRNQNLEKRFAPLLSGDADKDGGSGETEKDRTSEGVQQVSLATMTGLREQMLAETGVGQGAMDAPPEEQDSDGEDNDDGQQPGGEPSDEEKAEILEQEREEAEKFQAEQNGVKEPDEPPAKKTGRKGRQPKGR